MGGVKSASSRMYVVQMWERISGGRWGQVTRRVSVDILAGIVGNDFDG